MAQPTARLHSSSFLRTHARSIALSGGLLSSLVGGIVLAGWAWDIQTLKEIAPTFPTMKTNTAICFFLTGLALTLNAVRIPRWNSLWLKLVTLGVPITIGALTLAEYAFSVDFGIDELFIKDLSGQKFPGRMAANTALNFVLLSASLLWIDKVFLKKYFPSEIFAIASILFVCPSLVGYLYDVQSLFTIYSYTQIALHTAITFTLTSFSILLLRPERGLIGELTANSIGGLSLRGVLPKLIILIIVLGWFRLRGEQLGIYERGFGVSLMVIATIIVSTALLWNNSRLLNASDQVRRQAEAQTQRAEFAIRLVEDQRRADSTIRELMDRLDIALGAAKMGAWSLDLVTQKAWRSANHDEIFGYEKNCPEWSHELFLAHVLPEDRDTAKSGFQAALSAESFTSQYRIKRADNQKITWIEVQGKTFFDLAHRPTHMMGIVIDITNRKLTEGQLLHSAKMSSLGEMAGGIAHEINTPLGIISMLTGKLKNEIEAENLDKNQVIQSLDRVEKTVFRIAGIIKGLRHFSRDGSKDPFKSININNLIEETVSFCRERFKNHNIDLRMPDAPHDLKLECRPIEISQVLLNLLNNAYDAVHGAREKWITVEVNDHGDAIKLSVSDSGNGVQPKIRDKIMQPFFTTKEIGKGTGLGLSISNGIVESHKGTLTLDSTTKHTRFVVSLPKTQTSERNHVTA